MPKQEMVKITVHIPREDYHTIVTAYPGKGGLTRIIRAAIKPIVQRLKQKETVNVPDFDPAD